MTSLLKKIVALHRALHDADLSHAFGGALALAWCTQRARGTIDIDINVFVDPARSRAVLAALPGEIERSEAQLAMLERDGQVRLWWNETPVDVFLNTTPFHENVAVRARWEFFANERIPFLSCHDIAVFKAFFNRTKDWADLEEMETAGTLDVGRVIATLIQYLDIGDERVQRLHTMRRPPVPPAAKE